MDPEFEEVTEGEEIEGKEKLKTKWSALEALVGAEKRIDLVAEDLVRHFESRLEVMDGKAMVVCMSRRICVELYDALTARRPAWHHDDDGQGTILRRYGYPPDKQESATQTVLEQAELLSEGWALE